MPAKDLFHDIVKIALGKDAWIITSENLFIQVEDVDFYIDLAAERILVAERRGEKIAVEIKSFLGASDINEFHAALGQFLNYRSALNLVEPDRILYLAVPEDVYNDFFRVDLFKDQSEKINSNFWFLIQIERRFCNGEIKL
ncbi:XisH family protein [Lusitaniella coriacea LEGE 07167]